LLDEIAIIALEIVGHHDASFMFFREQPFAKLVPGIISLKHALVTSLVLYHAQVGFVSTILLDALEIEEQ
jgi:hypothetical protein